jgi:hypothetical protein
MTLLRDDAELRDFVATANCDRLIAFRVDGALALGLGTSGDRATPRSIAQLSERVTALRDAASRAVASLAAACAGRALRDGDDRARIASVASQDSEARLMEARAAIEAEWLATFEGALAPVIAWQSASASDLLNDATAAALAAKLERRAQTPFLDALCGETPCGPFELRSESAAGAIAVVGPIGVARIVAADARGDVPAFDRAYCTLTTRDGVLIAGPLSDLLGHVAKLPHGCAIAVEGIRDEAGLQAALARLRRPVAKGLALFGAFVPAERLAPGLELAHKLAPLAERSPSAVRGLLDVAVAIDEGMDRAPLMLLSRWRARAHAMAARLDTTAAERAALSALIGEFPRWFDTGAARIPLACALLAAETTEVSSS